VVIKSNTALGGVPVIVTVFTTAVMPLCFVSAAVAEAWLSQRMRIVRAANKRKFVLVFIVVRPPYAKS
jgi:hypothetical protein